MLSSSPLPKRGSTAILKPKIVGTTVRPFGGVGVSNRHKPFLKRRKLLKRESSKKRETFRERKKRSLFKGFVLLLLSIGVFRFCIFFICQSGGRVWQSLGQLIFYQTFWPSLWLAGNICLYS